jgi:hypothetical protein
MALENLSKKELLEYIREMRDRSLSDTTHVSETDQGYNTPMIAVLWMRMTISMRMRMRMRKKGN